MKKRVLFIFLLSLVVLLVLLELTIPPFIKRGVEPLAEYTVPMEMRSKIIELDSSSISDMDYLMKVYDFVDQRYSSKPRYYLRYWNFLALFLERDVAKIWEGTDDRPCNIQNYLVKIMLLESGRFSEKDIKVMNTFCTVTPHQYLQVKIGDEWINVDAWGSEYGASFGEHAGCFGCRCKYKGG